MRLRQEAFILILCFGIINSAFGVQSRLSNSKLSGQIAHPIIAAIHRDRFGFLWIGTQEGLYKFDGANHTYFSSDGANRNWIPVSDIRGISEDLDGNLLVATNGGGLLKWDSTANNFVSTQLPHLRIDYVLRLYVSKRGMIWLGTKDRLVLFESENKGINHWLASENAIDTIGIPYALVESNSGILFVGSDLGLAKISTREREIFRYDLSSLLAHEKIGVTALELDGDDNLIIGTDTSHAALIDSENGNIIGQVQVRGDTPVLITDFVLYGEMLVIATDQGLYLSDRRLSFIENISHQGSGLSSSDIYSLYLDNNQVWVGTYNGLDLLSLAPFKLFNNKNSAVNNDILSINQDEYGRIWVGTYDGLYLFNEATGSHSRYEYYFDSTILNDRRITALAEANSQIWIGYFKGGVQVIDIATGRATTPDIKDSGEMLVLDISIDQTSKSVWIATNNYGVIRITPEKTHYYNDSTSLDERGITKLFDGNERFLLVSTSNNVYEYHPNTDNFSKLEFNFGFGSVKTIILSIAEDQYGNFFFGTKSHGLFKWAHSNKAKRNLHLIHLGEGTDLASYTVYGIEIDSTGNLWCSTQNGVVKLSPEGRLIKRFTTADGLQGNDFTLGASFKSRQGLIYFGGTNGYNRFDPDEIEIDNTPSPMRLTGISLPTLDEKNLGEVSDLESLQLTHKDRFVTFQFSVLDFIDTERNQFRHILENFDAKWIENGTGNTATYTNLPPGDYVFRVQGANSAGIWNREGIALNVTVLPAPWLTWWAYSLYGLALISLLWGMQRIYRSYAIERRSSQLALEMFETQNRADDDMQEQLEIQDELVRSAYQHNLTTLGLVSDFIRLRSGAHLENSNHELAESTIERIAALYDLEDCLSYQVGGPVANLYQYTEGVFSKLLKCSPVSPETIITINEVASLPIPAELASPLSIVIYELLENCIQHAFQPVSPANYIHVKFSPDTYLESGAHCLELSVHDSGIGITDNIDSLARKGRGIAIVQFIAKKLGGELTLVQGNGTTICLIAPNTGDPYPRPLG